ncbi:hypothetical protein EJ05DRAFT_501563 [Pseudovirgaria hyperparasitica]|uniref:Uncharacterized protein n=1 Tax=Pseudovirgaria hyperparasitica TaxID=470096 RepID=A0A6A6W515_9PEZI|nr:uncharacterized protein EJ05DRAFT_501563 [Pseudovirgaria hyperparasitica]KAF2757020.1 hypothetical protein EJ05DRAFT_501563 [Pseudovirgaria hyperparasitica]
MDKATGIFKNGWHPEKKESWRGDNKGLNQVAGWMGKGKQGGSSASALERANNHQSAPLSTLKDPSSFGPPPKHQHYHGAAAAQDNTTPDRNGWGAPVPPSTIQAQQEEQRRQETNSNKPKPPPRPYQRDTTGLSTVHLPKPPKFGEPATASTQNAVTKPKPPSLPARPPLPPRQNSNPDEFTPAPPPSYTAATAKLTPPAPVEPYLNQGALNRLGKAGVSVQGFNIGRNVSPPSTIPASASSDAPQSTPGRGPQLNELSSRFSKMTTSPSPTAGSSQGTTFAEKQAAVRTANAFRNDPSSVSFSDARSAASTANNVRERHGEQIAAGWKTANGLNQKYGVMNRVNGMTGRESGSSSAQAGVLPEASSITAGIGKKAPPPPPKKKELGGAPPPVPLSSKPKPQG